VPGEEFEMQMERPDPPDTGGESSRIGALYERYRQKLLFIALKIVKDQSLAEDALHSTFEAALRHKGKILAMDGRNFLCWSVTIIEHKCIDSLRRNAHIADTPFEEEELASREMPVDLQVLRRIGAEQLRANLTYFDEADRAIVTMRYFSQLSYRLVSQEFSAKWKAGLAFPKAEHRVRG
jgi:RNA polymerase sigma factor (sigma-70 family)